MMMWLYGCDEERKGCNKPTSNRVSAGDLIAGMSVDAGKIGQIWPAAQKVLPHAQQHTLSPRCFCLSILHMPSKHLQYCVERNQ